MQGMSEATFKRTLYIDNLPPFYVEKDIRDYIESHSYDVGRIALFRYGSSSKNWGCSKGHALVVLKDEQQALAAISALDGKVPPNAAFFTGKEESSKKGKVRQMKLRVTPYRPSKRVLQPSGQTSPVCVSELRYPDLAGRENSEDELSSWGSTGQGSDADMEGVEQPATPVGQHYLTAPGPKRMGCSSDSTDSDTCSSNGSFLPASSPAMTSPGSASDMSQSPSSDKDGSVDCTVSVKLCAGLRIKTCSDDPTMCLDFSAASGIQTPDNDAPIRRQASDTGDSKQVGQSVDLLKRALRQKEMAVEDLTVQLAVEKTECMRLEDEWSTAQVKADELQSTADELLQQNAELRGEIRVLKTEVARRATHHSQLEERLEMAKDRITKLVQDKSIMSSQMCAAQQQLHSQEDKIAQLQQELVSLRLLVWQQVLPASASLQSASSLGLATYATGA